MGHFRTSSSVPNIYVFIYIYIHAYIYIYIDIHTYIYIYISTTRLNYKKLQGTITGLNILTHISSLSFCE